MLTGGRISAFARTLALNTEFAETGNRNMLITSAPLTSKGA